jgi:hypothetical protein
MRARLNFIFALAALAIFAACGGPPAVNLPGDATWSSAHFDYHVRASESDTCPDVLTALEQHFNVLQTYLGFDWPAGVKIAYYKFTDAADFAANGRCPADAGGCAPGTSVESSQSLDTHELVHAYLAPFGAPPWVLTEGVAVALSCTSRDYAGPKPTLGWDQLASVQSGAADPVTAYSAGAWLVGYLLSAYEPKQFLNLYRVLPRDADSVQMDAVYRQVYGVGLADIWAAALAEDQPRNNCPWQCAGAPLPLDGSAVDTSGLCGVDVPRPFSLAAAATISFATTAADFVLGPCGQAAVPATGLNGGMPGGLLAIYHLDAGSFFLSHSSVPGSIVGNNDASGSLNPTCPLANDLSALAWPYVYMAVPPSSATWFLPVPAPPVAGRELVVIPGPGAVTAAVCAGCGASGCSDPSAHGVAWADGQVLVLQPDPARAFSEFTLSWP